MPPRKKILSDEQNLTKKKKQKKIENLINNEKNINLSSSLNQESLTNIDVVDNPIINEKINNNIEVIKNNNEIDINRESNLMDIVNSNERIDDINLNESVDNFNIIKVIDVNNVQENNITEEIAVTNEVQCISRGFVQDVETLESEAYERLNEDNIIVEMYTSNEIQENNIIVEMDISNEIKENNIIEEMDITNEIDENSINLEISKTNEVKEHNIIVEMRETNEVQEDNINIEMRETNEVQEDNIIVEMIETNEVPRISGGIIPDAEILETVTCEILQKDNINENNVVINEIMNNENILSDNLINIKRNDDDLSSIFKNNALKDIINKLTDNTNNNISNNKEYILNENQFINILEGNINTKNKKYNLNNLMQLFSKFNEAVILVQIIDGNIKYIEKKGYESRNQSVIDLIIKTNNFKLLPNAQFVVFTNDYIDYGKPTDISYLLTFCKNKNYKTSLFPNFNFNNWNEANIGDYENIYNNFINNRINWEDKKDLIFWSGSNTNIIRKKIYDISINYDNYLINLNINSNSKKYTIAEHAEYKYLLNMNGYSYAGRLNYLFLTGSCVIILKNEDDNKVWEEFYYKYFIPGEDYIEILYNDSESASEIIERINKSIKNHDCLKISENGFNKAQIYLNIDNIYNYIHDLVSELSVMNDNQNKISQSVIYIPKSDIFYKNRIKFYTNSFNFNFKGNDIELNIYDVKDNVINVKIVNNNTIILYNNKEYFNKYTPLILSNIKNIYYEVNINNNILNMIIENKYNLIKCEINDIDNNEFIISNVDIKTENGGWCIL
jgi:trichohyalin